MPVPVLFALAAVGAGVSLLASEKAAKSAHGAAQQQALLLEKQAERINERSSIAIRQTRFQGQKLKGKQVVAYAASGVDVSSGSTLAVMEDTARQINDEVTSIQREAKFQIEMANSGASSTRAQAEDQRKASRIANYANFAQSIGSAGSDYMKYQAAITPESEKVRMFQEGQKKGLLDVQKSAKSAGFSDSFINKNTTLTRKFMEAQRKNPSLTFEQFMKSKGAR